MPIFQALLSSLHASRLPPCILRCLLLQPPRSSTQTRAPPARLQDLNQHQILPILLTGAPLASDERQRQQARHAPDERQLRWQEHRLARHSLDPNVGREGKKQKQGQKVQPGLWSRQLSGWDSDRSDWGSLAGGDSLDLHAAVSLPAGIGMGGVSFQAAPEQQRQTQDLGGAAGHMSGALVGDKLGNADPAAAHGSNGNHASTISTQGGKGGSQQRLEERLSPADYQRMLQGRGLDCRGWKLVVTGHSLGAAVAALVGMHLRDWCPGILPPHGSGAEGLLSLSESPACLPARA